MVYLRRLGSHFDPVYIKPATLSRAVSLLATSSIEVSVGVQQQPSPRREQDRRCGVERRSHQRPVILDTRSPHARRQQGRRRRHDVQQEDDPGLGIDVFA